MQDSGLCKVQVFAWAKPKLTIAFAPGKSGSGKQILRIMKLTAIILLTACLQASAVGGYSQKITLSVKEAPLEQVLKSIEKQSGFYFNYMHEMVKQAQPVTMQVKDASLEEVLVFCFKGQPLDYTVVSTDKLIIIKEKKQLSFSETEKQGQDPPIEVRGVITDENGAPAHGVNVMVKGTSKGTTTNLNGEFILKDVSENAVLLITSVGYDRQEVLVKNKEFISLQLKVAVGNLDELQVIAYGATSKRFSTGHVSTVKAVDIEKQPVQNPLLALQGRVSGIFITQTNGIPGGGVTVRIQGRNSISLGLDPLYIIDGVPYFSQLPATNAGDDLLGTSGGMAQSNSVGNPLSYINPNDIESIEILKDADATAIYGSRAANGAVLITTKKGKAGQMKCDVNLTYGWGEVGHKWGLLNSRQYLDMRYEALKNNGIDLSTQSNISSRFYDLKVWDTTRHTDWQEVLIGGTAKYINSSVSLSGGTPNIQYLVSGNYHKETTVFPGDFNDQKGSLHFNISSISSNRKLKMQFTGNYMHDHNRLLSTDLTQLAVQTEPVAPALYNEDGTLNWAPNVVGNSTWINPLAELYRKYNNKTMALVGNLFIGYQILPGLNIISSLGYTTLQTKDFSGVPLIYAKPESRSTSLRGAIYGNRDLTSWIFEPQIKYNKSIGKGKLEFLIGSTIQQNNSEAGSISALGFNSDEMLDNKSAATEITSNSQYIVQYKYNALFGRANYNFQDKYILNISYRRDGTSRFGPKNQFHNFGSLGFAWLFSEENFLKKLDGLSFGKLRISYGTTGSDQIGDYSFMSLYNFLSVPGLPYQNSIGIYATGLPNPNLAWEGTRKLQVGIDVGWLSDRILIGVTYSRNRSSNQLLGYTLPTITGNGGIARNFPALIQNTSWELTVSTINIKWRALSWISNLNFTVPRNKLLSFPNIESSTYASGFEGVIVDQPLGVFKTFHYLGVDETTGRYLFEDKDGNPTFSASFPNDYVKLINTSPRYYGGIQNNIKYKGLELDFLFYFVKQQGRTYSYYNGTRFPGQFSAGTSNQPITVLDRWQKPGDVASVAKYSSTSGYSHGDHPYTDASFIRLKNLSLAYELPVKWQQSAYLKKLKFYIQGQNLLTITKWKGLDPETQNFSSLPPLRVFTVGLQVGL